MQCVKTAACAINSSRLAAMSSAAEINMLANGQAVNLILDI